MTGPGDRVRRPRGYRRVGSSGDLNITGIIGSNQEVLKPHRSGRVIPARPGPREMTQPAKKVNFILMYSEYTCAEKLHLTSYVRVCLQNDSDARPGTGLVLLQGTWQTVVCMIWNIYKHEES